MFLDGNNYKIKYDNINTLDPELKIKYLKNYEREEIIENKGLPIIFENNIEMLPGFQKSLRGDLIIKLKLKLPSDLLDSDNNL